MQDIFLSYSSEDRDRLMPLVAALEAEGWTVFWDHRSIKVGEKWREKIEQAIQECSCVVVVWSENSRSSKWVIEEATVAEKRGVLYPISIDHAEPPFGFQSIQAADFTDWDGRADHPEFVELKEQLSLRLNLRRVVTPRAQAPVSAVSPQVVHEQPEPVIQPVIAQAEQVREPRVAGGGQVQAAQRKFSGVKALGSVLVLGLLAGVGYWYSQLPDDPVIPEKLVVTQPVAPPVTPEPKTYAFQVQSTPADSVVSVNGKPLKNGQRFEAGTYTVTATADGFKPYRERIEIKDTDHRISFKMEPDVLPFEPKMVEIPGGTFQMGCDLERDDVEGGCLNWEKPLHQVQVPSFWMSETEVTVGQYLACVEAGACPEPQWREKGNKYHFESGSDDYYKKMGKALVGDNYPIVGVSWKNAQDYVGWLSDKTGKKYRLPTESEWEYAARAGTETAYPWGKEASHEFANYGTDDCCDGLIEGSDKWFYTSPVGSFPANPLELKDMHGNVWEWVEDCWQSDYEQAPNDGSARAGCDADASRVLRGGSWFSIPRNLRSAVRNWSNPSYRFDDVGFRAARTN